MLRRPIYAYVYASPASYLEQVAVHAILFIVYRIPWKSQVSLLGWYLLSTSTAANFAPSPCIMHNKENINE